MSFLRSAYRSLKVQYIQNRAKMLKGWRIHYSKKLNLYFLLNLDNYIDFLIYTKDKFEPEVLNAIESFIKTKEIKTFIDVGSNIGQMSLYVAKTFPHIKIYSFEAYYKNYRQHLSSMLLNNLDYNLYNLAISDAEGELTLYLPKKQEAYDWGKYNSGMPSITLDSFREKNEKFTVKAKTLDSLVTEHKIDTTEDYVLLKIDVEGAELVVINGFKEFLSKNKKIVIIIEMLFERDKDLYEKARRILLSANFKMYDMKMNQIVDEKPEKFRNTDYIFIKD